jgi:hypothetical protein
MIFFTKKMALVAVLLLAFTSRVYSDSSGCQPTCCPCPQPVCCGHVFVDAELLYLWAFEGGLSTVCDSTQITDTSEGGVIVSTLFGEAHDPDFQGNLGYRVGVGFDLSRCSDIEVYWTHYHLHTGPQRPDNEHRWRFNYNTVDFLYRSESYWSSCFALSPFAGLRYANIDQRLRTHFISTVNGVATTADGEFREDFWGIGPLFGLEGDWGLGCGFSFYGNASFATLFGRFHVRSDNTQVFTTGRNVNHLRKRPFAFQAVLDTGFGLRWRKCFCCDKLLLLQLGLEQHTYFNHNRFCGYGDLGLYGITFGVGIVY